jgi:allantoate deiminase
LSATVVRRAEHAAAASDGAARVMHRCAQLARITEHPGQILRTFLSPAMDEVHRTVTPWLEAAGMAVAVDRAGNLRGVYPAHADAELPRLLIGSHLDTVPNAGAYDGVLGVLAGVALVEAIAGRALPFAIEVIGFSDEEGTRFGAPFLGSRASVGELDGALLDCVDPAGVTVRKALEDFAARRPELMPADLSPRSAAYLEFHIEQGPVLENRNLALGIVEGLAGQSRSHIVFRGNAGHAGTTPMNMRRDALAAAAEWMTRVEAIVSRFDSAVATVGQIEAEPGAVNVIPGLVRCSLDVRHGRDAVRDAALEAIFDEAKAISKRRGIEVEAEQFHAHGAVHLDEGVVGLAERAAAHAGYSTIRMTSGAGHDAMVIAPHVPSAMIFLRNPGGLSHHPDESVAEQDVAAALHAGLCFLDEFAAWLADCGKKEGR